MPISFCTSLELDLVFARWHGVIGLADFRDNFSKYLSDIHYRPGRRELVDLSDVEELDLDFERIRLMLHDVNSQHPQDPVHTQTVVLAPDDDAFGTGRMYQQLADFAGGIHVELFRTETEALQALNLPHRSIADMLESETFLPHQPRIQSGSKGSGTA